MKRTLERVALAGATLVLSVGIVACGSQADDSAKLEAQPWAASAINGRPVTSKAVPTASFSGGTITGSTGVNTYRGTYTTEPGNKISIELGPMTLIGGTPSVMKTEQEYIAALKAAESYAVDGQSLKLLDAKAAVVVAFDAKAAPSLTGTTWQAQAYNNGRGGLQSVIPTATITAQFGDDGTLSGSGGVNQYSTKYTADGTSMKIDDAIVTTKMAGDPDAMAQEAAYLAALPKAATYEIEGESLWIRDAEGAALAQYVTK